MKFESLLQTLNENVDSVIPIEVNLFEGKSDDYKPVKLPYSYQALEPYIDRQTMEFHYNKHYKGYIKKLNELTTLRTPLEKLVRNISSRNDKVRFNAGGAYNHQLFWEMLSPEHKPCSGLIKEQLEKKYGTIKDFQNEFSDKATTIMGSGWCWLIKKDNKLDIVTTPNQDNPLMNNLGVPVLGIDMWEHAFYLKHGPEKKDWVKDFFKTINWDYCNTILSQ